MFALNSVKRVKGLQPVIINARAELPSFLYYPSHFNFTVYLPPANVNNEMARVQTLFSLNSNVC